jgi:hypothetical protein
MTQGETDQKLATFDPFVIGAYGVVGDHDLE